jgi:1,4-alpha-glucan branching enzyme
VVHLKKSMLEKMPGDEKQKFADLRNLYAYMLAYPGQKMIFMGDEFGQRKEWNEAGELQWEMTNEQQAQGLQKLVARLNEVYKKEPALHDLQFDPEANHLVVRDTENAVVGILREAEKADDNVLLVSNFTPNAHSKYRIGVDAPGVYHEILNSDAAEFGGSNVGNPGGVTAEAVPAHGKEYSIEVTLPPLATVAFKKN